MIVTFFVFLGNHTKNYFGCHGYIPGHEFIPTEMDFLQHKNVTIFKISFTKNFSINFLFFPLFWIFSLCLMKYPKTEVGIFFIRKKI